VGLARRRSAGKSKPTTPQPTLLGDPRSSYVRSARMALVEKGIAYALEPHAPHSPPVDAIHPFRDPRCGVRDSRLSGRGPRDTG
jgi:hypothetical protein